jgi:BirA family biotin operon repressor/biotin-[acetyl-CoA-carboxylase] ligase
LTLLLARVAAATIREETACAVLIKAPNDIYMAGRKIGGVLVEGRTASDKSYIAVAGVGINVNQTPGDFSAMLQATAGSLCMATGREFPRGRLAIALLRKLEIEYRNFHAGLVARNC